MYSDNVRKAIIVAQHLDDKDVARATNINDAFKLLKSKEQLTQARATAASKPEGASWCTILQMDALELCKTTLGRSLMYSALTHLMVWAQMTSGIAEGR